LSHPPQNAVLVNLYYLLDIYKENILSDRWGRGVRTHPCDEIRALTNRENRLPSDIERVKTTKELETASGI
jgi:hypothetical protein